MKNMHKEDHNYNKRRVDEIRKKKEIRDTFMKQNPNIHPEPHKNRFINRRVSS